jgi:uncharacterized protein (DUF1810 family)
MERLERFLSAQEKDYELALSEIKRGKKTSHWMWYIFPQIMGLGHSETAKFYSIRDLKEAQDFLEHQILGKRLIEITAEVIKHKNKTAHEIFGSPDDLKFHSSMTLFSLIPGSDALFNTALQTFFSGRPDIKTIEICTQ